MASPRIKSPALWAVAAVAAGATSLGINLLSRRQQRLWRDNPDPLEGRAPQFPAGRTLMITLHDGAEIRTVRAGHGRPVVLVHGLTASIDEWGPVAERLLARGFEVVGIDQRGHGRSTLGTERFSPRRLGEDLAVVLDALDLHRAVLVGHSMGGMAVQSLAVQSLAVQSLAVQSLAVQSLAAHHRQPTADRVAGLVLVSTSARLDGLRHRVSIPVAAQLPVPVPSLLTDSTLVLGTAALSAFGPAPSLNLLRQSIASLSRCPDATRQAATAGLAGFDVLDDLAAVTLPTLVLSGTRDLIVPFHDSEQIAAALPHATLVPIEDAGHMVIWERPDEVAALIAAHADRVAPTAAP